MMYVSRILLIALGLILSLGCRLNRIITSADSRSISNPPNSPTAGIEFDAVEFNLSSDYISLSVELPSGHTHSGLTIQVYLNSIEILNSTISTTNFEISTLTPNTTYRIILCKISNASDCKELNLTTLKQVSVTDVYSGNGNWNQYVRNNGSHIFDADNTPCDGTENNDFFLKQCLHSGELKKLTVPITAGESCTDYELEEQLQAFNWVCLPGDGTYIDFYTSSLKEEKSLAHLLEPTQFKKNQVIIKKQGQPLYSTSSSQIWWQNQVLPLPEGSTSLSESHGIYTLASSRTDGTHNIEADGISIVTLGNAKLSSSSTSFTGAERKFLWIEGNYGDQTDSVFVFLGGGFGVVGLSYSQFRNLSVTNTLTGTPIQVSVARQLHFNNIQINQAQYGIRLRGDGGTPSYINLSKIKVSNSTMGMHLQSNIYLNIDKFEGFKNTDHLGGASGSSFNYFMRITNSTMDFGSYGLFLDFMNSIVNNVRISNMTSDAIRGFSSGLGNITFSNLIVMSSQDAIHNSLNDDDLTFHNITSFANARYYETWRSRRVTFSNHALINNATNFHLRGSSTSNTEDHLFANLAISGVFSIPDTYVSNIRLIDNLLKSLDLSCYVIAGAGPNTGLTDTTCNNQGTSTAIHRSNLNFGNSLVGSVLTDNLNIYNQGGIAPYNEMLEINQFESIYRGWGKDGPSISDPSTIGPCTSGNNCRLWDVRMNAQDNILRNTTHDGENQNTPFAPNVTCPEAVNGNRSISDYRSNTYLINAIEIMDDDIGDDDGLCESGESCIYSPNYGAYQGEGDYLSQGTCTFVDGTITGVQMYAYPIREI